jgi:hypothetical protein
MHQVGTPGVCVQPVTGHSERLRVAVEADQGERRMGVEQRDRVPTKTHRGVEHHGRPARQRGPEQLKAPVQQNGSMLG